MNPLHRFRIDRKEWFAAINLLSVDLPLLMGLILASGLDSASVLILFGVAQFAAALLSGPPMPVQPLKAVAILAITQRSSGELIYGAGIAIGLAMLILVKTGLLDRIARVVPKTVVRGIQFGLGLQLATLGLKEYLPAESALGYWIAGVALALTLMFSGGRKLPAAVMLAAIGAVYAFCFKLDRGAFWRGFAIHWPAPHWPRLGDIWQGFLLLGLAQLPLSIANSILATAQTAGELFPERALPVRKIAFRYSVFNVLAPLFGGIPVAQGASGVVGLHELGARTGGAPLIYGLGFVGVGLCFSQGFARFVQAFPFPILGVILLLEARSVLALVRDMTATSRDFGTVLLVGLVANGLPYGYLVALVGGTVAELVIRHSGAPESPTT